MSALVSVIVPVHNGAAHVAQTLAAVLAQSHPAVELVVVDDASSDNSATVVAHAAPAARLLRRPVAGGVSRARNEGLDAASGHFVCFLDQDDIWHPTHLARQLAAFERLPELGAVVVPYQHWYPNAHGEPAPSRLWPAQADDRLDPEFTGWVYHQFLVDCWALTSATMIRREALDEVSAFDADRPYGEDWELWLRLSRRWRFGRLGGPPVLYRQHPTQGSRRARATDHRTELLLAQAQAFGLASADGRAISRARFEALIAGYQAQHGLHHLRHGDRALGRRTLWRAWQRQPARLRHLALALAATLGWRGGAASGGGTPAGDA
jgi:glycosyltransferase involved in cell wall biosynthesis